MSAVRLIAVRSIMAEARARSTWVIMGVTVVAIAALNVLPTVFQDHSTSFDVAVTGSAPAEVVEALSVIGEQVEVEITTVDVADEATARAGVLDETYDLALDARRILVRVPLDPSDIDSKAQFVRLTAGFGQLRLALADAGLDDDAATTVMSAPPLDVVPVDPDAVTGDDRSIALFGSIAVFFLLQMTAVTAVSDVAEERETRLVEVLLVTTSPRSILAGKLLGSAATAVGRAVIVAAAALASAAIAAEGGGSGTGSASSIGSRTFTAAAVAFLIGYALYAPLAAAIGSLTPNRKAAGSAALPLNLMLLAGYILSTVAVEGSNAALGRVLTVIPFTAPTAVPGLWATGDLSDAGALVSAAVTVAGAIAATAISIAVYERSVTDQGRAVKLPWARAAA